MTRTQPTKTNRKDAAHAHEATLIDHLHELRTRLFWILLALILAMSASYLIKDQIMAVIMQPLGGQRLVYLTPIGGFNFIFKVSLYFGLVVILPVIVYHLYRFLEPLMHARRKRSVTFFIVASFLLAVAGGSFAYIAGLPAALHFLSGFDIQNVSAMLTVESYLAFVVAYVLGFAALFQIPLILMIINTITPVPPKKLLGSMRFVILGAFIAAAIISPTPDVTNQAILAVPIILMYVIGVMLVWAQSRSGRNRRQQRTDPVISSQPINAPHLSRVRPTATQSPQAARPIATRPRPVMDIAAPRRTVRPIALQRMQRPIPGDVVRRVSNVRTQSPVRRANTSIDGVISHSQPISQAS